MGHTYHLVATSNLNNHASSGRLVRPPRQANSHVLSCVIQYIPMMGQPLLPLPQQPRGPKLPPRCLSPQPRGPKLPPRCTTRASHGVSCHNLLHNNTVHDTAHTITVRHIPQFTNRI